LNRKVGVVGKKGRGLEWGGTGRGGALSIEKTSFRDVQKDLAK